MTLDYLSELGHQTMNSDIDRDSQWISWNDPRPFEQQVDSKFTRHGKLDCPLRVPEALPADLLRSSAPDNLLARPHKDGRDNPWLGASLYTHLCMGTIPVMIHHNGGKENREDRWTNMWLQSRASVVPL